MSKERFDWLAEIGTSEVICHARLREQREGIYDKCWELRKERGNKIVILNQFEEFGNCCWHYE